MGEWEGGSVGVREGVWVGGRKQRKGGIGMGKGSRRQGGSASAREISHARETKNGAPQSVIREN